MSKWMAYERSDGSLVGRGGMERPDADDEVTRKIENLLADEGRWVADLLELGWALLNSSRGQGFATDLGRAALGHAFGAVGARTVVAYTERHNVASRAVMERLGMKYAGEIRTDGLIAGLQGVHADAPFAVYVARV